MKLLPLIPAMNGDGFDVAVCGGTAAIPEFNPASNNAFAIRKALQDLGLKPVKPDTYFNPRGRNAVLTFVEEDKRGSPAFLRLSLAALAQAAPECHLVYQDWLNHQQTITT